jgi:hypothetical protein
MPRDLKKYLDNETVFASEMATSTTIYKNVERKYSQLADMTRKEYNPNPNPLNERISDYIQFELCDEFDTHLKAKDFEALENLYSKINFIYMSYYNLVYKSKSK